MKNIKLRKLLGGISASVLAGGSVLAVTACNKGSKEKEESLVTQVTKLIEGDTTILFAGPGSNVEKVKTKIVSQIIPNLRNAKKLVLHGDVEIKKDGDKDLATGELAKSKYNFKFVLKETADESKTQTIEGSFNVTLDKAEAIGSALLDKFNPSLINLELDDVAENASIDAAINQKIKNAVILQWHGTVDSNISSTVTGQKATEKNKNAHEVKFKLDVDNQKSSKEFSAKFKYKVTKEVEVSRTELSTVDFGTVTLKIAPTSGNNVKGDAIKTAIGNKVLTILQAQVNQDVSNDDFEVIDFKQGQDELGDGDVSIESPITVGFNVKAKAISKLLQGNKEISFNVEK